jgi:hypothetical protein
MQELHSLYSNRVQAHGVEKAVGEVADGVHDQHRPERGISYGIQLSAGGNNLEERKKQVEHKRESGKHHEPVKPCTVLPVSEWGKPATHGVRVSELHNS